MHYFCCCQSVSRSNIAKGGKCCCAAVIGLASVEATTTARTRVTCERVCASAIIIIIIIVALFIDIDICRCR